MNILPHSDPHKLVHVHSAEEGSTDTVADKHHHGDAVEDEHFEIPTMRWAHGMGGGPKVG